MASDDGKIQVAFKKQLKGRGAKAQYRRVVSTVASRGRCQGGKTTLGDTLGGALSLVHLHTTGHK